MRPTDVDINVIPLDSALTTKNIAAYLIERPVKSLGNIITQFHPFAIFRMLRHAIRKMRADLFGQRV